MSPMLHRQRQYLSHYRIIFQIQNSKYNVPNEKHGACSSAETSQNSLFPREIQRDNKSLLRKSRILNLLIPLS